jgi:hypothetical protein
LFTDPEKLKGIETLWRIVLENSSEEITELGLKVLFSIYSVKEFLKLECS